MADKTFKQAVCDVMLWARDGLGGPADKYVLGGVQMHVDKSHAFDAIRVKLGLDAGATIDEVLRTLELRLRK